MAAKMATVTRYFHILANMHCRSKVSGAILCIFAQIKQHNQNKSDRNMYF